MCIRDSSRTPQDELKDEETLAVIKRLAKQRKESIVQYEAAGRPELAVPELSLIHISEPTRPY